MTTHPADIKRLRPIQWRYFARNGRQPNGYFGKQLADGLNHVLAFRRKNLFTKALNLGDLASNLGGVSGSSDHWHGRFYAGIGAKRVEMVVGLDKALVASVADPYVDLLFTNPDASTDTSDTFSYAAFSGSHTSSLDSFAWGILTYDLPEDDGVYEWVLRAHNYARPFAATMYEVCGSPVDTATGGVNPNVGAGVPIWDGYHQQVAETATNMINRNRSHLIAWSQDTEATPYTVTSSTYTNILSNSTTSPGASTPGFTIQFPYHRTAGDSNLSVGLAVYASTSSGSSGAVQINNGTATVSVTGIGTTAQWYTTTGALPVSGGGSAKFDIQAKCDGTNTLTVRAVSLYSYQ